MNDFIKNYHEFLKRTKKESDYIRQQIYELKNELSEIDRQSRIKNRLRKYFV